MEDGNEAGRGQFFGDPLFINPGAANFDVKSVEGGYPSDSPAIEKGVATVADVNADFTGGVRPEGSAMDIGAYEHAATSSSPNAAVRFEVTGIADPFMEGSFSGITVRAVNSAGNTAAGYLGTVEFESSDTSAVLPPEYTFAADDGGIRVFDNAVSLATSGNQSVTVYDKSNNAIKGKQENITVVDVQTGKFTVRKDGKGNFKVIQDAVNAVPSSLGMPYIIEVQDDYSYAESVKIDGKVASSSNTLTIKPSPGRSALIEAISPYFGGFSILNTNYVTVAGFRIRGGDRSHGVSMNGAYFCVIRNNSMTNAYNQDGAGVYMNSSGSNSVYGNVLYGNVNGVIVYDYTSDNNVIFNNVIYGNTSRGIWVYRETDNNKFYNNTLYNNVVEIHLGHGGQYYDPGTANQFINNILYAGSTNGNAIKVNRYNSPGGLPSGTVFNYNDIYPVGSGAKAGNIDGTNYNTLANWKTATGQDTYSISSNPQFIDAAAKNFQLKSVSGGYPSNSPAINMGKNLAEVQIDFLGKARPLGTSTDIGAYEYP